MAFLVLGMIISMSPGLFSQQQPGGSGIVYGDDHAFVVGAPEGWVLDNAAGASRGLHAVFYPLGGSWAASPVVMYVNTANKEAEGLTGPEGLMTIDLARLKAESPDVRVEDVAGLTTEDGRAALVRRFSGDNHGNFEAVAYIDVPKVVIMVVLSSRSRSLFESSLPAFEKLVHSVHYLTDQVSIEKKR